METIKPTLIRGRAVWDQINMPESEFRGRVHKIKEEMKKEGIEVLLLYGTGPDHYGNTCYVSNFISRMPQGAIAAIPQTGEATLMFEGPPRNVPDVKKLTWISQVRPCRNISQECMKYLKEKGGIPSTLGLAGFRELMPYHQFEPLRESVSRCKITDFGHTIRDMRAVKSQRECDQIRRSSRILKLAFDYIAENTPKDMNERVLEVIVDRVARLEGADDCRILVARPQEEKWAFRPAEDVTISSGETLVVYLAVESETYWSEAIRTFVAESASLTQPKLDNAQAIYQRILQGMKAGRTLSQFYKEAIGEIKNSKAEYIPDYGLGQGIGLSLQELPAISRDEVSQLTGGMCLTLRLAIKDKEMGAVMIGNTVHLSTNGPEVLTR